MSRRAARCTQADVVRVLKALAQTGIAAAVEISTDGVMRIVPIEKDKSFDSAVQIDWTGLGGRIM